MAEEAHQLVAQLYFYDGLDQVLVDRYEIRAILIIDHHVGEADKEALFFVNRIGHTISHGRNKEVADVDAIHSSDADANFLAFRHCPLLPLSQAKFSFFDVQTFDAGATFYTYVCAFFCGAFLAHWTCVISPAKKMKCRIFHGKLQAHWRDVVIMTLPRPNMLMTCDVERVVHGLLDLTDTRFYTAPAWSHTDFHSFPSCSCWVRCC
jgi:hypothetical protein